MKHVLRRGAGLLMASLLAAAVAEVAVRLVVPLSPRLSPIMHMQDPAQVKIEPHGEQGYRPRPNATFSYRNGAVAHQNALGWRGPLVDVPKPRDVRRVIILGGSSAHGWGVNDDETIDAYLREILENQLPAQRIEVISLAFDGYDSYQDYERLQTDGLRLAPDVVVVHSGINDVRNARFGDLQDRDPRTMLWLGELTRLRNEQVRGGPTLVSRAKHYSYLLRLVAHVRQELRRRKNPADLMHPADGVQFVPNLEAVDYFERNVKRMLALRSQVPFATVLSVPPSSLRSRYAPEDRSAQSYWINDAATTQALRDSLASRMQRIAARADTPAQRVFFLAAEVPAADFLDDCHLAPAGNRAVAAALAAVLIPLLAS